MSVRRTWGERFGCAAAVALLALCGASNAGQPEIADQEIKALIDAVGVSECTFERNGKRYDASAAASHLSLKYRRGKKYADSAEHFIERLASKSSRSGKPYFMDCPDQARVETGRWLSSALQRIRDDAS